MESNRTRFQEGVMHGNTVLLLLGLAVLAAAVVYMLADAGREAGDGGPFVETSRVESDREAEPAAKLPPPKSVYAPENGEALPVEDSLSYSDAEAAPAGGVSGTKPPSVKCECVCPRPEPCPVCRCPECKPVEVVCHSHEREIRDLKEKLKRNEEELARVKDVMKKTGYPGETASLRRAAAAKDDHLMIELPTWGEELTLPDDMVEKLGLSPDERQRLEETYREFRHSVFAELQKMYADLMGDPEAGVDSTINALIHSIMELSPKELCRERMVAMVRQLAAGGGHTVPGPDSPPCELAAYLLFKTVDDLEQEIAGSMGEKGSKALWTGTSSFSFSARTKTE